MMRNSRFTLLELLVVIAILGILISMLLPTINKARKGSQAAVCASNQKQTGIAVIRWSIDNSGY